MYLLQNTIWIQYSLANFTYNTCPYGVLFTRYPCTVRLIGGLIPEEGTVEVCMNAVWSSVCDSSWDYKDAFVVCRQLGYPATGEDDVSPI